jgi:hypothetical protein
VPIREEKANALKEMHNYWTSGLPRMRGVLTRDQNLGSYDEMLTI